MKMGTDQQSAIGYSDGSKSNGTHPYVKLNTVPGKVSTLVGLYCHNVEDPSKIADRGVDSLNSIHAEADDLHKNGRDVGYGSKTQTAEEALDIDRIKAQTLQVRDGDLLTTSADSIGQILQPIPEAKTALRHIILTKSSSTRYNSKAHNLSTLKAKHLHFPYSNPNVPLSISGRCKTVPVNAFSQPKTIRSTSSNHPESDQHLPISTGLNPILTSPFLSK